MIELAIDAAIYKVRSKLLGESPQIPEMSRQIIIYSHPFLHRAAVVAAHLCSFWDLLYCINILPTTCHPAFQTFNQPTLIMITMTLIKEKKAQIHPYHQQVTTTNNEKKKTKVKKDLPVEKECHCHLYYYPHHSGKCMISKSSYHCGNKTAVLITAANSWYIYSTAATNQNHHIDQAHCLTIFLVVAVTSVFVIFLLA